MYPQHEHISRVSFLVCLSVFACTPVHSNSLTTSTDSLACIAGALTKQLSVLPWSKHVSHTCLTLSSNTCVFHSWYLSPSAVSPLLASCSSLFVSQMLVRAPSVSGSGANVQKHCVAVGAVCGLCFPLSFLSSLSHREKRANMHPRSLPPLLSCDPVRHKTGPALQPVRGVITTSSARSDALLCQPPETPGVVWCCAVFVLSCVFLAGRRKGTRVFDQASGASLIMIEPPTPPNCWECHPAHTGSVTRRLTHVA